MCGREGYLCRVWAECPVAEQGQQAVDRIAPTDVAERFNGGKLFGVGGGMVVADMAPTEGQKIGDRLGGTAFGEQGDGHEPVRKGCRP